MAQIAGPKGVQQSWAEGVVPRYAPVLAFAGLSIERSDRIVAARVGVVKRRGLVEVDDVDRVSLAEAVIKLDTHPPLVLIFRVRELHRPVRGDRKVKEA